MNGALAGRTALVTGGSRGIGRAIVATLSARGAEVAFTYARSHEAAREVADEIIGLGGRVLPIQADNADQRQVRDAVSKTVSRFGKIDILVNNAAILKSGLVWDYSASDLECMIAVNIKGVFWMIQAALAHMPAGGRIINIGSVSSDYMPFCGESVYAMTKGAIASLTKGLARDLGPRGITINNVQPGRVETEMIRSALGDLDEKLRSTIAVQRFGEVDEVAEAVAFLAQGSTGFITGAALKVDGGTTA